jgi:hypothetical protein
MRACKVCGGTKLERFWYWPRWKLTIAGGRENLCFMCRLWAARMAGIVR